MSNQALGQDALVRAKNNRSGHANGREDGVSTAVIARRQTSPLCQAPEHVFSAVVAAVIQHFRSCGAVETIGQRVLRNDCLWRVPGCTP